MKTCAECPYIRVEKVLNAGFAFCAKTRSVVPQEWDQAVDPDNISLTRIPAWCPLAGVGDRVTNEKPLPPAQWQTIPLNKGQKK